MTAGRPSTAVIGAGVAGLTAAYLLQQRDDVTLFEADDRLGGHAHTHDVVSSSGDRCAVDSGFLVCNRTTYPNLMRLFGELGVDLRPAPMGLSVRCDGCRLEYAGGRGLRSLFADRALAARPRFLRMLTEISRFYRHARAVLAGGDPGLTVADFLRAGGYSAYFSRHFLLPVVSSVWSSGSGPARAYPATYLFRFLANHGMLAPTGSLRWLTVSGGSRRYVERAAASVHAVETGTAVRAVSRRPDGIEVRDAADRVHRFDRVVLATHADRALDLLADPTPDERSTLAAFAYSANQAVLHRDERVLPRRPDARVSWNYAVPSCEGPGDRATVTYDVTRLQGLPGPDRHLVSINPGGAIPDELVTARMVYTHPIYTVAAVAAQARLPGLNQGRTAFAGSYHGWGFHEDACRAGVAAAAALGVTW